jgi:hypothetical protein
MKPHLTIGRIRSLTGAPVRDGARVLHTTYDEMLSGRAGAGRSIEQRDRAVSSPLHNAMKSWGIAHFRSAGYRVFPRQIGLWGFENVYRFSDFAIEKRRHVRLIECLTPWYTTQDKIEGKLQLDAYAPVDFICTRSAVRKFRRWRYEIVASLGKFDRCEIVYIRRANTHPEVLRQQRAADARKALAQLTRAV